MLQEQVGKDNLRKRSFETSSESFRYLAWTWLGPRQHIISIAGKCGSFPGGCGSVPGIRC
jgi:hypothetical protein